MVSPEPQSTGPARVPGEADLTTSAPQRLVATVEAAALVGMRETDLLRHMGRMGIPGHHLVWRGSRRLAIRLADLVRITGYLATEGLERELQDEIGEHEREKRRLTAHASDLEFELELVRAQSTNARTHAEELQVELRRRLAELETTAAELELARAEREASATRRRELVEARTLLEASRARVSASETLLAELRRELEVLRSELARAEARGDEAEQYQGRVVRAFSEERDELRARVERLNRENGSLRKLVTVGRAARSVVEQRLAAAERVETVTQSYCDRLEARVAELEGRAAPPDQLAG